MKENKMEKSKFRFIAKIATIPEDLGAIINVRVPLRTCAAKPFYLCNV